MSTSRTDRSVLGAPSTFERASYEIVTWILLVMKSGQFCSIHRIGLISAGAKAGEYGDDPHRAPLLMGGQEEPPDFGWRPQQQRTLREPQQANLPERRRREIAPFRRRGEQLLEQGKREVHRLRREPSRSHPIRDERLCGRWSNGW
jgi:hypothetical protein